MSIFFKIWLTSGAVLLLNLIVCALLELDFDENVYTEVVAVWTVIQAATIVVYGLVKFIISIWGV